MIGLCILGLMIGFVVVAAGSALVWELIAGTALFVTPVALVEGRFDIALTGVGILIGSIFAFAALNRRRA